jgi:hypothetical protein
MTDRKSPRERLLDLVVFAPAGLAILAVEEFPKLVDKGRHRVEGQVRTARFVGQAAVQVGRRQLDHTIRQWGSTPPRPAGPARTTAPATVVPMPTQPSPPRPPEAGAPPVASPGASFGSSPGANGRGPLRPLAIPGYDSLSASQVVQRLGGLSRGELMDVRAHEQSLRHRRTILNRVEQLLADADAATR